MPELVLADAVRCRDSIQQSFNSKGYSYHPAIISYRCVEPKHSNRTILSVLRQDALENWLGADQVATLIDEFGLKAFNYAANEIVKNFDCTSLGGRYSFDTPRLIEFAMNPAIRSKGVRLKRIYATDHESVLCMAANTGCRMSWDEAIRRILADLTIPGFPEQVEIFTGRIKTHGSRPTDLKLAAQYLGPDSQTSILEIPAE